MHLVVYDGEVDPGEALMLKFQVSGFPTLVAFDASGKEIDRLTGYKKGATAAWFLEMPDRQMPLDDFLKKALTSPKDGRLQLLAAQRLVSAQRGDEAKKFYQRAEKAGDPGLAVTATWALGRYELDANANVGRRKLAEKILAKYPTSEEGELALRYLATLPKPPVTLIEQVVMKRLAADNDNAAELNSLAYVALRAGAMKSAVKVAERLEQLSKGNPGQLDTVAEIHHMNGDTTRAVAVQETAVALAKGAMAAGLKENLERFKKGGKVPGQDMLAVTAPSFEPPRPEVSRTRAGLTPAVKYERDLQKKVNEECAGASAGLDEVQAHIMSGEKAGDPVRVVVDPAATKPLAACIDKAVRALAPQPGTNRTIRFGLVPKAFADAFKDAVKQAETKCAASAGDVKGVDGLVTGAAGGKPTVTLSAGTPALKTCVEQAVSKLKLPTRTFRTFHLTFTTDTHAAAKP